jgi:hypothetical protein
LPTSGIGNGSSPCAAVPVRIDPATWGFTAGAPLTLTVRTEVGATVSRARITGPIDLPVTLSPLQVAVVVLAPAG